MKYIIVFILNIFFSLLVLAMVPTVTVICYLVAVIWNFRLKPKFFTKEEIFEDFTEFKLKREVAYTGFGDCPVEVKMKGNVHFYKNWFSYIWGFRPRRIEKIKQ